MKMHPSSSRAWLAVGLLSFVLPVAAQTAVAAATQPAEAKAEALIGNKTDQPATPPKAASSAEQILSVMHAANLAEISAGSLAQQHASAAKVKQYGQHLVKDHEKADKEVMALAQKRNFKLTTAAETQELQKNQQAIEQLKAAPAGQFDHQFAQAMLTAHKDVISNLEQSLKTIDDKELASLIHKTLPQLKQHEKMAQALVNKSAH